MNINSFPCEFKTAFGFMLNSLSLQLDNCVLLCQNLLVQLVTIILPLSGCSLMGVLPIFPSPNLELCQSELCEVPASGTSA